RPSIKRGIDYLIRTQNADGSWTEHETTGTGFPKVFYLKYDMYRNAWPLLAFATYRKLLDPSQRRTAKSTATNSRLLRVRRLPLPKRRDPDSRGAGVHPPSIFIPNGA